MTRIELRFLNAITGGSCAPHGDIIDVRTGTGPTFPPPIIVCDG